MKSLVTLILLAFSLTAHAAPSPFEISPEAQTPFLGLSGDLFRDKATEWLDDAKKAILQGKSNMEKWFHDGRQYIKQDGLLCAFPVSAISTIC